MMPTDNGYLVGWIDSSIHDFLAEINRPPAAMTYSLITCLDSCFDLPVLVERSAAFRRLKADGDLLGKGFIVRTSRLLAAEKKQRIFFGFDEVFFFQDRPSKPKPESTSLTGPTELTTQLPTKLLNWMTQNHCGLALGDGTGLNFAARLSGIARYLVAHRMERVS